jgi:hypothetical protein
MLSKFVITRVTTASKFYEFLFMIGGLLLEGLPRGASNTNSLHN